MLFAHFNSYDTDLEEQLDFLDNLKSIEECTKFHLQYQLHKLPKTDLLNISFLRHNTRALFFLVNCFFLLGIEKFLSEMTLCNCLLIMKHWLVQFRHRVLGIIHAFKLCC